MRKSVFLSLGVIAVLAGCQFEESYQEDSLNGFDVSLESIISEPETKTYADEQHLVVWHNDDRVSVFEKKEYWEEYKYTGRTGTTGGRLDKITSEGSGTGGDLDYYYAVYPHSELNGFNSQGHLLLTLPHEQQYDEFSFGRSTNLMVSSSEDDSFKFKNIGGYLVFKLYGEGVSVSSIRLVGNNEEEITGDIDVVISPGTDPVTTMSTARYAEKYNDAVLVCDPPIALGATAAEYKEFWFVLPPMTFEGGFSIEVTTADGDVWTKTTEKPWTITRNHYTPVSAMEVAIEIPLTNNIIYYTSSDGEIVTPYKAEAFGAAVVSNTYIGGQGTLIFDREITSIGYEAFKGCTNLVSIILPDSMTNVGYHMFSGCTNLSSISIPGNVTEIGTGAFYNCSNLSSIILPEGVLTIGGAAFRGCSTLSSLSIPNSVIQIDGTSTFSGCSNLEFTIVLPEGTKEVGHSMFYNCSKLQSVSIPESVTSIKAQAFYGCKSLSEIVIPNNVTSIAQSAFKNSGLTSISLPEGLETIEYSTFEGCSNLTNVSIPSSIRVIKFDAFHDCEALSAVDLPAGLLEIDSRAFYSCRSLLSLTIPSSVKTIGDHAFAVCMSMQSLFVYAYTPPTAGEYFLNSNGCSVYVPSGSLLSYTTADNWSRYSSRIRSIPDE